MGVLTKPDRIEEGTFDNWKPVLEGKEQKLLHSYYVVKNPDPKQLSQTTWEQARVDERKFFQNEPWTSLGNDIIYRLGAVHLAAKLAQLLEQVVTARMPHILEEVKALALQTKKEIEQLPERVHETQILLHFSSLLTEFSAAFTHELLGSREEKSLADDIYSISLDFWADMM